MIVIYTDRDLGALSGIPFEDVQQRHVLKDLLPPASWAEDVYFWREEKVKALKRRNAPLVVPEWLESRSDVDR